MKLPLTVMENCFWIANDYILDATCREDSCFELKVSSEFIMGSLSYYYLIFSANSIMISVRVALGIE